MLEFCHFPAAVCCLGSIFLFFFLKMDGLQGKDMDMAGERRAVTDKETDTRQRDGKRRIDYNKRIYSKEATVIIDMAEQSDARAEDIIKVVNERIGGGKILAVRPRQGKEYEITLTNREACDGLDKGLIIKGKLCEIRKLKTREYVVSFIHLPAYIEDSEILNKLENWGVTPASEIRRRVYPGTDIADGTRYLRVKFPKEVVSLPYSTKFDTEEGTQHFRIMHDRQVKTCRLCMNPGHVFKDCPEFKCFQCDEQGHFARDCDAVKCPDCRKVMVRCECWMEDEDEIQNIEAEDVGGQMLKETELQNDGEHEEQDGANKEANVENQEDMEEKTQEGEMEEGTWASLETTQGTMEEIEEQGLKDKEEGMQETSEEGKGMDRMSCRKDRRETLRRRTLKVIPNLDAAKKKRLLRKEQSKEKSVCENRFQVLMEEEEEEGD